MRDWMEINDNARWMEIRMTEQCAIRGRMTETMRDQC